jgi:16S rRNA (uracil1498-N3)-methyltransferase
MRSSWVSSLEDQEVYTLTGDQHHHLAHVVRAEAGEELLLLDGKGRTVKTLIESISKKEIKARKLELKNFEREYFFDLALGMPKKEALELSLKQAVELGFRKIYLIRSAYSQMRPLEADRLQQILVSALEQSNAPYLPEVSYLTWESLEWAEYQEALMLDSQQGQSQKYDKFDSQTPKLLIVGPEGGFSVEERELIQSKIKVLSLMLPTPILRTPTAVSAGAGFLLGELLK